MTGGALPAQSAMPMKGLTCRCGKGHGWFLEMAWKPRGLEREGKRQIEHKLPGFTSIIVFMASWLLTVGMCIFNPVY